MGLGNFRLLLSVARANFELHLIGLDFDEELCVQAIADKLKLKVKEKDDVTIVLTPKD